MARRVRLTPLAAAALPGVVAYGVAESIALLRSRIGDLVGLVRRRLTKP